MRAEIGETVEAIGRVSDEVGSLSTVAEGLAGAVDSQRETTAAIETALAEADTANRDARPRLDALTGAMKRSTDAAAAVSMAADGLQGSAGRLQTALTGFVAKVSAG